MFKELNLQRQFGETWEFEFESENLTGATIQFHIRTYKNELIDNCNVSINGNKINVVTTKNMVLDNELNIGFVNYGLRIDRPDETSKTEYRGKIIIL